MQQSKNQEYLQGLCTGDQQTILSIYRLCFSGVRNFVLKNKGTVEDAEETFQNALYQLTARVKVKQFEITSTFEGYLFTVCKNIWRKELNRKKKEVRNDGVIELPSKEEDLSTAILEQERWELFEEKVALLSVNCRELLNDYFAKVPYEEIVEKFNYATENVAFQRVFKCKKRLAELIKKDRRFKGLS